jgi:hypothetical protein
VTLVWYDPPGVGSVGSNLINNLDLFVESDTNATWIGNAYVRGGFSVRVPCTCRGGGAC